MPSSSILTIIPARTQFLYHKPPYHVQKLACFSLIACNRELHSACPLKPHRYTVLAGLHVRWRSCLPDTACYWTEALASACLYEGASSAAASCSQPGRVTERRRCRCRPAPSRSTSPPACWGRSSTCSRTKTQRARCGASTLRSRRKVRPHPAHTHTPHNLSSRQAVTKDGNESACCKATAVVMMGGVMPRPTKAGSADVALLSLGERSCLGGRGAPAPPGCCAGLFVVEMNSPMLLFDGSIVTSADTWTIDVDEAQLEVMWGAEGDVFDAFSQVLRKTVEVTVMPRGGRQQRLVEAQSLRQFTYQELRMIAERSGFQVRAPLRLPPPWPGAARPGGRV